MSKRKNYLNVVHRFLFFLKTTLPRCCRDMVSPQISTIDLFLTIHGDPWRSFDFALGDGTEAYTILSPISSPQPSPHYLILTISSPLSLPHYLLPTISSTLSNPYYFLPPISSLLPPFPTISSPA